MTLLTTMSAQRRVIVFDNFNRANNNAGLGTATTEQTWTSIHGTIGVNSQKAKMIVSSAGAMSVVETGYADGILSFRIPDCTEFVRPAFRVTDANNYFLIAFNTSTSKYEVWRVQAGSVTALAASQAAATPANNDVVRVELKGPTIRCFINGALMISVSSTFNQSVTKHGINFRQLDTPTVDDFKFEIWGG